MENWDYLLSVNLSARINKNYSLIFPVASFRHFRELGGGPHRFFFHVLLKLTLLIKVPCSEIMVVS